VVVGASGDDGGVDPDDEGFGPLLDEVLALYQTFQSVQLHARRAERISAATQAANWSQVDQAKIRALIDEIEMWAPATTR
jgi:uncharacterized membrane protein